MILAILAAGMGSRYGGLKQIDPITDNGEFIIDFSIYDAIKAGFDKVVFIIKEENYQAFRETVGSRVEKHIKTEYAFQRLEDIPSGKSIPDGRTKPWGTTHAVCAARELLNDSFAVINSDDFYGRDAFFKLAGHLKGQTGNGHYCMVGYTLRNTLTDNGTVSRGRCEIDDNGMLSSITELTKIARKGNDAEFLNADGQWEAISGDTTVSMNCWGFTKDAVSKLCTDLESFFDTEKATELKSECFLPGSVDHLMCAGECDVKVYNTDAEWFGVTYSEDKDTVKNAVRRLIDSGIYPENLWN